MRAHHNILGLVSLYVSSTQHKDYAPHINYYFRGSPTAILILCCIPVKQHMLIEMCVKLGTMIRNFRRLKYAFREQSLSCTMHLNNLLDLNMAEFL